MALISNIRKSGQILNLGKRPVDIEDNGFLSNYFILSEYDPKFTGGKNTFLINGSQYLAKNSNIEIEVLDSENNSLYVEVAKSNNIAYTEGGALRVSVYVYSIAKVGVGKLYLVGTTVNGKKVRWVGNIQINPSVPNISTVVFYRPPQLTVTPTIVVGGNQSNTSSVKILRTLSGTFKSYCVTPVKGSDYGLFDPTKQNVDYRAELTINTIDGNAVSGFKNAASMVDSEISLTITQINDVSISTFTDRNIISEIINDTTIRLKYPIYVIDSRNKKTLVDVTQGTFSMTASIIPYDSTKIPQYSQSIAVVEYSDIDTFCGNVYRHKLYRKSLNSPVGYQVLSDTPITNTNLLVDTNSQNSYYASLGSFPSGSLGENKFVTNYWFTSSNNIVISRDGSQLMDGMKIVNNGGVSDEEYVIVKNDTYIGTRDGTYIPYSEPVTPLIYDNNFISCSANIPHELSFNAIITKHNSGLSNTATLGIYFTSSLLTRINGDFDFNDVKGIKLGEIVLGIGSSSLYLVDDPVKFYSKFENDFCGTIVIYTKNCDVIISNLTFSTYSDPAFSPQIFTVIVPCQTEIKNQQFQFKAELFDINNKLVYSNLYALATFDPNGVAVTSATIANNGPATTPESDVSSISGITGTVTVPAGGGVNIPVTINASSVIPGWTSNLPLKQPDKWLDISGYKVPAYNP